MRIKSLSSRVFVTVAAATVVTALLAPAASAAADCTWEAEYLPVRNGADWSSLRITGVDGQGDVSGFHTQNRTGHTLARWTAAGMEIVPRPDGVSKFVTGAGNASGVVVAIADRTDGSKVAMTHTPGAGYRELPTPAGYVVWGVEDINSRGDVLGRARLESASRGGAVLWRADGSAPEIIEPPQARLLEPIALGEDGTVLLDSMDGSFLWRDGVSTALPDLGYSVDPRALTRDGVVFSSPYGSPRASWKWHEATGAVERFDVDGVVEAVNEDGLAVGYLDDVSYTGAVWQGTKLVTQLPLPLGAGSGSPDAVGDSGVIAGFGGTKPVRWLCR